MRYRRIVGSVVGLAMMTAGLFAPPTSAAEQPAGSHKFSVKADFTATLKSKDGDDLKMGGDASFLYTWHRRKNVSELVLNSIGAKIKADGQTVMEMEMSRAAIRFVSGGKRVETKFQDANPLQQKRLAEMFDTVICKLKRDRLGRETGREIIAADPVTKIVMEGAVDQATLFHVSFPGKKKWKETCITPIADKGRYSGKLTYEIIDGDKQMGKDQVEVKVSGTLDKAVAPKNIKVDKIQIEVAGRQTYDKKLGEWVSGKLDMKFDMALSENDEILGRLTGTVIVTLDMPKKTANRK